MSSLWVRALVGGACALAMASLWAADPAAHHADGKALGNALAASENARLRSGATAALTPRYNPAPPQASIYGSGGDFSAPLASQRAHCTANPNDPACGGVELGSRRQPKPVIAPSDPALAGQTVVRSPSMVLGDIASTYSTCTVGSPTQVSPAEYETQHCALETGGWSTQVCSKTLNVTPRTRVSCTQGTWIGASSLGLMDGTTVSASAYCNIEHDGSIRHRLNVRHWDWGVNHDLELRLPIEGPVPSLGSEPALVASVVLYGNGPGGPGSSSWVDVYVAGPGCAGGEACEMRFYVFQGRRDCDHWRDGGACVSKEPGRIEARRTCADGKTPGNELYFLGACELDGPCTWARGSGETCWSPTAEGAPETLKTAYKLGQSEGDATIWSPAGESEPGAHLLLIPGHPDNQHAVLSVNYPRPAAPVIANESWSNGCAALEPLTPGLPRDGSASTVDPLMPMMGEAGQTRCVKTASVCADGPSTRIIEGEAVTRECWHWQNTFQCHSLTAASSCGPLQAAGCSQSLAPTCASFDVLGRCSSANLTFECKVRDAVYEAAANCGAGGDFCAGGSCWDTASPANDAFALAVAHMQARLDAGNDFDLDRMEIFRGNAGYCGRHSYGIKNCCNNSPDLITCSDDEKALVERKNAGLCHLVGDYCASRTLLGCKTRHYKYCCFTGKLARIVQEQGRPMIGKVWGDPRDPDCSGFTVEQFSGLNWAAIDLSEWYASINPVPPDMGAVTTGATTSGGSTCYYGNGRCGP